MNARQVISILGKRHSKDLFIPECKNGPSMGEHYRMDAWAMKRSWANPCFWAYEIKVSRSDFLRDDKWRAYLDYCNEFYFVCPHGLIQPEELPDGVGLLWVSKNCSKLYTKKKAVYRDVEIPESLYKYILMARTKVGHSYGYEDNADYWENWLINTKVGKELGYRVSKHISKLYDDVRFENERLRSLMEQYDEIRKRITELGHDPDISMGCWQLNKTFDKLVEDIPQELIYAIKNGAEALEKIQQVLGK